MVLVLDPPPGAQGELLFEATRAMEILRQHSVLVEAESTGILQRLRPQSGDIALVTAAAFVLLSAGIVVRKFRADVRT